MKPIFRSAMFGFQKDDVANFIARQNQEFENKLAEKDRRIESIEQAHAAEKLSLEKDAASFAALRERLRANDEIREEILSLAKELSLDREALISENENCAAALNEIDQELGALRERAREADSLRAKAEKFDALAGVLSNIVGAAAPEKEAGESEEKKERIFFTASSDAVAEALEKQKAAAESAAGLVDRLVALLGQIDWSDK